MDCGRFDVLWEHGLSMVICDFVGDVCSDPHMRSAEALQSHLLDGRCVADWAQAALQRLRSRVQQVSNSSFDTQLLLPSCMPPLLSSNSAEGRAAGDSMQRHLCHQRPLCIKQGLPCCASARGCVNNT